MHGGAARFPFAGKCREKYIVLRRVLRGEGAETGCIKWMVCG